MRSSLPIAYGRSTILIILGFQGGRSNGSRVFILPYSPCV